LSLASSLPLMVRQHSRDTDDVDSDDTAGHEEPSAAPNHRRARRKSSAELLGSSVCAVGILEPSEAAAAEEPKAESDIASAPAIAMVDWDLALKPERPVLKANVHVRSITGEVTITAQGNAKLTDEDAEGVATFLDDATVTKLVLANHSLGNMTAIALAEKLQTNTTLTWLSLVNNEIGDEGALALANALSSGCPNLTTLFISGQSHRGHETMSDAARARLTRANEARTPPKASPLSGLCGLVL